ncbi:MAG TPA: hypothetical protein VF746_12410 [Longimicrobium sp.]|jgi:hypothetical protein
MRLLRVILAVLALGTAVAACGSSSITGPDQPTARHEQQMGAGDG